MGNAATNITPQPYASELAVLDDAENQLADLRARYGTVPDYATKNGYKDGKQAIQALTKMRTGTDKARLAITRPHRDFIEQVNQRAKGLIGEVEQLEAPHREAKREVDEAEQRKKEERIARLREKLAQEVTSFLDTAEGLCSSGLADLIDAAEGVDIGGYYDVTDEAQNEKARVIRELRDKHHRALQNELMAQRERELEEERRAMARERAEMERLRAQQEEAEKQRKAAEEAAAKQQAEAAETQSPNPAFDTHAPGCEAPAWQEPAIKRGSDMAEPETVTITRKEYDALLEAQAELDALKDGGVDNWSGYDDAMATLYAA